METLFEAAEVTNLKQRIASLHPDSAAQWGKMGVAQMMAHCSAGIETAIGDRIAPRMLLGRLLGGIVKPMALKDGEPMRKNSPTSPDLIVNESRDFATERTRLLTLIDRFAAGGVEGCTVHPHAFFGKLTPEQWSKLMHKHLDHHLRQFGV